MRKMISWKKSVVVLPTPIDHEFWRSVTCLPQRDSEGPFTIGCVTISPSNAIKQIDFLEKCVSTASLMMNKELRFEVATGLTKTELREFFTAGLTFWFVEVFTKGVHSLILLKKD